jgi:hypothetical protein
VAGAAVDRRLSSDQIYATVDSTERRSLIAAYGEAQFLTDHGVRLRSDEWGTLWCVEDLKDTKSLPWHFLEVINATPEPDGTLRHYFVRVPPWMRDVHHALAWAYWFDWPWEYKPVIQT